MSVTDRFFNELNGRRIDTNTARSETLSIIHGMRYLKLGVCWIRILCLCHDWLVHHKCYLRASMCELSPIVVLRLNIDLIQA